MALSTSNEPRFHIVLVQPEIPNNTGNIGRTAMATGCRLHLIHPLGFDLSEKACRRAGLDYWKNVDCREHQSWDDFLASESPERLWLYTTKTDRAHWDSNLTTGDYLVFGRETSGVEPAVHDDVVRRWGADHRLTMPMEDHPAARSLNLATAVCVAVYEGLRQLETATV